MGGAAITISKQRKDLCHIIKASVHLAQYGRVTKAVFRGSVFFLDFEAARSDLTDTPLGLAIAILDTMQTMAEKAKGLGVMEIHVRCHVGGDRHDVRTPASFLEKLLKYTKGKRDLLTGGLVDDWVRASRYKRMKGARR